MRWFVAVSQVGQDEVLEKQCLSADDWQVALERARAARGESTNLSELTIEDADEGGRAVDSELELNYQVSSAPDDAPLAAPKGKANGEGAPEKPVAGQKTKTAGTPLSSAAKRAPRTKRGRFSERLDSSWPGLIWI